MNARFLRPPLILAAAVGVVLLAACTSVSATSNSPATCNGTIPKAGATVGREFVCVDSPPINSGVGRSIDISGRAASAGPYRVSVDLLDESGLIATRGETEFPNASAPARVAAWKISLKVPSTVKPGHVTLVVRAFDTSYRTFGEDDIPVSLK